MNGRGESPTFAMFCTYYDIECYLFAEVADEIEAVQAFHDHVAEHGLHHAPSIHMEPMREEWRGRSIGRTELDSARNLFRAPAEAAS